MAWQSSDTARFREYHQKSGGALRLHLRSVIPIVDGKTIEEVALNAKYKEGCEFMLRQIDDILSDENKADDASSASFQSM
jgi:hypothetical protein